MVDIKQDEESDATAIAGQTDNVLKKLLMTLLVFIELFRISKSICLPQIGLKNVDCLRKG